ncbi:hypothetical protein [Antribacter gilvus]|uniref:hypothetical protein n=1 Tax=Antribacter gilvus TaxID=2304675 RepID=UPI000F7A8D38|nr:hypothetical protein [Antribacter gilvus]
MASTSSTSGTAVRRRVLHPGSVGMILGGLIIVVGSVLPWVSTPVGSIPGHAGPGLWTLCAAFVALAGAVLPFRRVAVAHCLVAGLPVAFLAAWQVVRLVEVSAATDSWGKALPGMGLVMVAGGAVILLRTAWRLSRSSS